MQCPSVHWKWAGVGQAVNKQTRCYFGYFGVITTFGLYFMPYKTHISGLNASMNEKYNKNIYIAKVDI